MDQIDTVIEQVAEAARLHGDPRQLAINGIEPCHQPAHRQAEQVMALPECEPGSQHQQQAERGDRVGCDPVIRAPAHSAAGGCWPQPFGHQIRNALVGIAIQQRFKLPTALAFHRLQQRRFGAAQRCIKAAQRLTGDLAQRRWWLARALIEPVQRLHAIGRAELHGRSTRIAAAIQHDIALSRQRLERTHLEQIVRPQQQHRRIACRAQIIDPTQVRQLRYLAAQTRLRVDTPKLHRAMRNDINASRLGILAITHSVCRCGRTARYRCVVRMRCHVWLHA